MQASLQTKQIAVVAGFLTLIAIVLVGSRREDQKLAATQSPTPPLEEVAEPVVDVAEINEPAAEPPQPPKRKYREPLGNLPEAAPAAETTEELEATPTTASTKAVAIVQNAETEETVAPPRRSEDKRKSQNVSEQQDLPSGKEVKSLIILNPKRFGHPITFRYGTETVELQPGEMFTRNFYGPKIKAKVIQFNRGGKNGNVKVQLKPGHYRFGISKKGWTIRKNPVSS